jgi:hypothetical protein
MGQQSSKLQETKKFASVETEKIASRNRVVIAIITLIGVVITAIAFIIASKIPVEISMHGTQTAEAKFIEIVLSSTLTPTVSPSSTITPSPSFTATPSLSSTATLTSTPTEPTPPVGYVIYDNFDANDMSKWAIPSSSSFCNNVIVDGGFKSECDGKKNPQGGFTLNPVDKSVDSVQGVAMAFYTLPVQAESSQWGKYQLNFRFGSDCNLYNKMYQISIRPNELAFLDIGRGNKQLNSPAPKQPIRTYQTQVVRIEYSNTQTDFFVNDENVLSLVSPPTAPSICVQFQSDDNKIINAKGYRGIVLLWFAIKPEKIN